MKTKPKALVIIWLLVAVLIICMPLSPSLAHSSQQKRGDEPFDRESSNPKPVPPTSSPEVQPSSGNWVSENHAVTLDPATGRTEVLPELESGDSPETRITATDGQRPPDWQAIEISSRAIQTFTVPTPVSNPADWPYSPIVRLNVTWPSGGTGTCSGVIVDPRHALTAGHCVFDYNDPGRDYEPCPGPSDSCWAAAIEVIPAYDNGNAPYGKTHMIQPMSWTSWTGGTLETKDYAHDMAVVYFDRPVGALTGWYGYGAAADNFYLTQEFSNSGYPGADLSDGQTMWVRDGTFDMIEIYQAGHRDLSYSGQSGSGYAYEYVDEYWRIYAIASHYHQETDQETITYCPRITTGKLADITYWIQGHTPQQPDLVPLDVRVTPTSIEAGRQISSTSFLIHNYSSNEWNGTLTSDVYLSIDSNIRARLGVRTGSGGTYPNH
jgi:V8-like Glu-specific endopeptidase